MTRRIALATLAVALVMVFPPATLAPAQTTAKDVSKKTAEAWETVKSYTVEKKKDAVAYGKKLVRDTGVEIKALEAKAAKASGDAKATYDEQIATLKVKQAHASKKLDEMSKATGAAWDSAKHGFADAYKDLHEAFDKAAAQFK